MTTNSNTPRPFPELPDPFIPVETTSREDLMAARDALIEENAALRVSVGQLVEALEKICEDRDMDMVGAYADGWYAAFEDCRKIAAPALAQAQEKAHE